MDEDRFVKARQKYADLAREFAEHRERSALLIREMHHRMSNSLQMVASTASAQLRRATSPETAAFARKMIGQANATARFYRALMVRDGEVDLARYLSELGAELERLTLDGSSVHIEVDAAPLVVAPDVAMPLALITNELVNNAAKYAFDEGKTGKINVRLERSDVNHAALTVADDGIGFPKDFQPSAGHGLILVSMLADSIKGSIHFRSVPGAEVRVVFPA